MPRTREDSHTAFAVNLPDSRMYFQSPTIALLCAQAFSLPTTCPIVQQKTTFAKWCTFSKPITIIGDTIT